MFLACILIATANIATPVAATPVAATPVANPAPVVAAKALTKATVRVTAQPAPQPAPKPTPKPTPKPAPAPAPKPAPAPAPKPAPAPAPAPAARTTQPAPATFRTYLTQAGCGTVNIITGPGRYAEADWYNNRVILGTSTSGSLRWIAYHECAHFKQLWQYGSVNAVWSHFGDSMPRIECDADRRAAAQLGWSAGVFCR